MDRRLVLAALLAMLASCGGAPSTPTARPTAYVEVQRVPFHATLPSGTVVALDDAGLVTIDGDPFGTLETDGRVEDLDGETIAALLPDGRVSFAGTLIGSTVRDTRMMQGNVAVLELQQDQSLTIRGADGGALATVPVIGATTESRSTVLFVVAVHLLTLARDSATAAQGVLEDEDEVVRLRVPIEGRPVRGPDTAPITIVMIEDFQCPFCARAEPTMESLHQTYGDRVRFVFVHEPLSFHDHAADAATVAEEARAQRGDEGFWAMHDLLFANSSDLTRPDLLRYAAQLGLDVARVTAALEGDRYRARLTEDQALAARIGASGTPTFFVNGLAVVGAQPLEVFERTIDAELAHVAELTAAGVAPRQVYARLMASALADAPARPTPPPSPSPSRPTPDPTAVYRVPIDGAPARGPADALVTIVAFSDFQCPFCSRVTPTLERILTEYGDDVRLVFRNNPLPFHVHAQPAAEAALEAYAQRGDDAFWQMHDLLFANQTTLEREDLERFAGEVHLDMQRFRRALDQHTHAGAITADQDLARQLGATGTPSFFINGRNLRGAQPFESFQALIDTELAAARARVASGTPARRVYEEIIRGGATAPVYLPGTAPAPDPAPPDDAIYAIPVPPGAPSRGAARAPVTIQIFSDFQCPFCARVLPTLETIATEYAGRVRFVWRNYPLPFHQYAELAAEAAMEVFAQRGAAAFWAFHDVLFAHRDALAREDLETYASAIPGVRMPQLRAALDDHRHQATIQADIDAVRAAGAEIGTPSFFIEGHLLQGAQPIEQFRTLIDRVLAERAH
jgi:protein-disulfide isomerase